MKESKKFKIEYDKEIRKRLEKIFGYIYEEVKIIMFLMVKIGVELLVVMGVDILIVVLFK